MRLCPWTWPWPRAFLSLASRGSVLGKAVLGLGLGLEPYVLDSTSGMYDIDYSWLNNDEYLLVLQTGRRMLKDFELLYLCIKITVSNLHKSRIFRKLRFLHQAGASPA